MDNKINIENINPTSIETFLKENKLDNVVYEILDHNKPFTSYDGRYARIKKNKKSNKKKQKRRKDFILDGVKLGKETIDEYNSLLDKHLKYFFKKKNVFNHLMNMKIV